MREDAEAVFRDVGAGEDLDDAGVAGAKCSQIA
jgi:hypothetical protein